ncbi:hypothetical protein NJ7G_0777 [Natrinema sp. J7-2]|nr:hypothetical protein NJ7G_0777 [Natrinema sp. J7-2]
MSDRLVSESYGHNHSVKRARCDDPRDGYRAGYQRAQVSAEALR